MKSAVLTTPVIPATAKLRQGGQFKFEASLRYITDLASNKSDSKSIVRFTLKLKGSLEVREWRPGCHRLTSGVEVTLSRCGSCYDLEGNKNSGVKGCNHHKNHIGF